MESACNEIALTELGECCNDHRGPVGRIFFIGVAMLIPKPEGAPGTVLALFRDQVSQCFCGCGIDLSLHFRRHFCSPGLPGTEGMGGKIG